MAIKQNPDKEYADEVKRKLKANGGYCPCSLIKSADTKCMCKDFREQKTPGLCHCGRFEKVIV